MLSAKYGVSHVLTKYLNLDPIERFFGTIRYKEGGLYDHPTPLTFKYRLRNSILGNLNANINGTIWYLINYISLSRSKWCSSATGQIFQYWAQWWYGFRVVKMEYWDSPRIRNWSNWSSPSRTAPVLSDEQLQHWWKTAPPASIKIYKWLSFKEVSHWMWSGWLQVDPNCFQMWPSNTKCNVHRCCATIRFYI